MPIFSIQFQPDLVSSADDGLVLAAFRSALPDADFVVGNDDGRYVNINFEAAPTVGWEAISGALSLPEIGRAARRACVVVCEGEHGWSDYLLLHHPDRTLILDNISALRAAE